MAAEDDARPPALFGYSALRMAGPVRCFIFGPDDRPRIRIGRALGRFTLALVVDDAPIEITIESRVEGDVAFVYISTPDDLGGQGVLRLTAGRVEHRWMVRWSSDPTCDAVLGEVRALRKRGDCDGADAGLDALERGPLDPAARFWCAFERGRILRARGRQDEASRAWEHCVAQAWQAGVDTWAARALRAAAYLAYLQRDFTRAIELLDRVRRIELTVGDTEGRINSAFYRGMIANERGALVEARRHYDHALAIARDSGSPADAFFETALALLHLNLGEFEEAQALTRPLLDRLAEGPDDVHHQAGERMTAAWILLQCGLRTGGLDIALIERLLDEGLALARDAAEPQLEMMGLFNRAWLSWWTGDTAGTRRDLERVDERHESFAAAHPTESLLFARERDLLRGQLELAEGALPAAEATFGKLLDSLALECAGQPNLLALGARLGLARVARRRGRWQAAADALDEGLALITELALDLDRRRTVTLLRDRPLICDPVAVIDERIDLAQSRGDIDTAFGTADALHALRRRQIDQRAMLETLSGSARERWEALGREIDEARAQYDRVRGDWRLAPDECSARLIAASVRLRRLFDTRLRLLEAPDRTLGPAALARLRRRLRHDEALVLLRVRSQGEVEAWWVTEQTVARALPADPPEWLAQRLAGIAHLFVVGDLRAGAWKLPRHHIGGRPLAARVGISFPGHAGALLQRRVVGAGPPLLVADPLDDLPAARRDGARLLDPLEGAHTLVGAKATRAAVLQALGRCSAFHFSGHGQLEDDDVSLALAGHTSLRPEDVIGAARVPARVVLNGCRTAVGFADQAVSMAGAFLTAGSRSVLGTVRPVNDHRASAFVRAFYRHGGADDPSAALRAATRWAFERGDDIWSAYRLMGHR